MIKSIRRWYYQHFPHYEILETKFVNWYEADRLLRMTSDLEETYRWVLAPEEDNNRKMGMVYLCRRKRVIE